MGHESLLLSLSNRVLMWPMATWPATQDTTMEALRVADYERHWHKATKGDRLHETRLFNR